MIIILSRSDDGSTMYVAEWLTYLNKEYIIVNSDDYRALFSSYNSKENELLFTVNSKQINLLLAESVWNRRNGFSMKSIGINLSSKESVFLNVNDDYYVSHRKEELRYLLDFVHYTFASKGIKQLGNFRFNDVNKMVVLDIARKVGLRIPNSFILSTKNELIKLKNDYPKRKIISKALSQGVYRIEDEVNYYNYVERISDVILKSLPETFFPSLFQIEIVKKYELRIFYLNEKCYSMVVFSQKSKKTITDFRKPNLGNKNRKLPYLLPNSIKSRIVKLMKALSLNTGSLDMIVDSDDNYTFLEVNPVGQFSMTSYPCNYYLEKKIAEYL